MKNEILVGDVVQIKSGYGVVQQVIGKNLRIRLSGQYGYGDWFKVDDIVSHAKLSPK